MLVRLEIKPFGSVIFGLFPLCSLTLVVYGTECLYLLRCCDRGKLQVVINLNRRAHTSVARPDLRLSRKVSMVLLMIQVCVFTPGAGGGGEFSNVQSVAKPSEGHVVHVMSHNLQVDEFKENHGKGKMHCRSGDETANSKNPPDWNVVKGFPGTWACLRIRN
jgi:hypothetical protein